MKLSTLIRNAKIAMETCGDLDVLLEGVPSEYLCASDTEVDSFDGGSVFTVMSIDADTRRCAKEDNIMGHKI